MYNNFSLHNNIIENIKCFIVSTKQDWMSLYIHTVDWEWLLCDKAGCLHLVLDCLAGQPGGAGAVQAGIHCWYLDTSWSYTRTIPVPKFTSLKNILFLKIVAKIVFLFFSGNATKKNTFWYPRNYYNIYFLLNLSWINWIKTKLMEFL